MYTTHIPKQYSEYLYVCLNIYKEEFIVYSKNTVIYNIYILRKEIIITSTCQK